ncbi:hypothetical protein [Candidatus Palauibacter sp.]|uniref:hypothetical protein n=1 Tax=Candidatus Palauibacter sp. TaxID=3101350 RepID=UPI003AF2AFBE
MTQDSKTLNRYRRYCMLAALGLPVACLDGSPGARDAGSTQPEADPAPLRAGSPRLTLGNWSGGGHTDFYDIAGVIVDRRAGVLIVANRGDATIRTFGLGGEWHSTRAGIGGGPRELAELTALFEYRGDSLLVWDGDRDQASIWPYSEGDVRRVAVPSLPDSLRYPRLHGALADGRLVWTAELPYRQPDEVGESHPERRAIILTSPGGTDFETVAATSDMRYFHYEASNYQQGRAPFSPKVFVLPRDSVILYGSTEHLRAEHVSGGGTRLDPITFSVASVPVTGAHRAWEIADRLRRLNSRPLPASLLQGQMEILDILPFPDSFPVLGEVVDGADGRVWVRGYRPPEPDSSRVEEDMSVWSVYSGPGSRGRDIEFPGRFDLLWADGTEAVGIVRDPFDVEQVIIVPLPAAVQTRREP